MNRVILNILRRNWFVIPIATLLATLNPFYSHPELTEPLLFGDLMGVIFVLGPFLISVEADAGSNTALRTLPVSTRSLGRGYWLLGVVLFPMLYLVCSPTLAALTHREPIDALPRVMFTLIGMGYGSIMTLLQLPVRRSEGGNTSHRGMQGRIVNLFMAGGFILHTVLLAGYRDGNALFYAALAVSPVFILASYLRATNEMQWLSIKTNNLRSKLWKPRPPAGVVRLYLWSKAAGAGLSGALMFVVIIGFTYRTQYGAQILEPMLPSFCVLMALGAGIAGRVWAPSIRALRMLPMSSSRLTCSLVGMQSAALLATIVTLSLAPTILNLPRLSLAAFTGLAIGFAISLCISAVLLRFNAWFLLAMMPGTIMFMGLTMTPMPYHAPFALLAAFAAVYETKRLLKRSGQVYRQKQPGQETSLR